MLVAWGGQEHLKTAVGEAAARTAALSKTQAELREARSTLQRKEGMEDQTATLRGVVQELKNTLRAEQSGKAKASSALEAARARMKAMDEAAASVRVGAGGGEGVCVHAWAAACPRKKNVTWMAHKTMRGFVSGGTCGVALQDCTAAEAVGPQGIRDGPPSARCSAGAG